MKCLNCGDKLELVEKAIVKQEFRGEVLEVRSPVYQCVRCQHQELYTGQGDILRRNTADEYRRRHGLLTSAEIKECRRNLRQTQEQFAEFLKVSPVSIKRWETWQVQEPIYDASIREKCGLSKASSFSPLTALSSVACETHFHMVEAEKILISLQKLQEIKPKLVVKKGTTTQFSSRVRHGIAEYDIALAS